MSDVPLGIELPFAGLAGAALGFFFFGGLWLTVRALPRSQSPALLMLGSFVIRIGATVAGFYFVMDGRWERMLACMVGLLLARTILVNWYKPSSDSVPKESVQSWK